MFILPAVEFSDELVCVAFDTCSRNRQVGWQWIESRTLRTFTVKLDATFRRHMLKFLATNSLSFGNLSHSSARVMSQRPLTLIRGSKVLSVLNTHSFCGNSFTSFSPYTFYVTQLFHAATIGLAEDKNSSIGIFTKTNRTDGEPSQYRPN